MKKKKRGMVFVPYDYEAVFKKNIKDLHELFVEEMLKNRYKCVYALKEIKAGKQFEIEVYPEFKKMDDVPMEGRKRDNSRAQKNLNSKNSVKYLTRIVNANFTKDDIWLTLTCAEGKEPKDERDAVRMIRNFIKRVNYQRKKRGLKKAKWICVTEHSPEYKIRWHFHLIMDGELDRDIVEGCWKNGTRNHSKRLDPDEYGLTGMVNYITKENYRRKGERRWNSSTGLKQPRVRKVHSKRPEARSGNYKPIEKYVEHFVRDRENIERQLKKWYPDKVFTDAGVYYNDFNGMFYIRARMRIP